MSHLVPRALLLAALAGVASASSLAAQRRSPRVPQAPGMRPAASRAQAAETLGYLARLGKDTVAVERVTRRGDLVRGVSIVRTPRTLVRRYELRLRPDGAPASLRLEAAPPNGAALETTEWTWRGDSVFGSFRRDTVRRSWTVAAAGAPLPFMETTFGPWDVALRRLGERGALTMVAGPMVLRYTVERRADGSLLLHLAGHDPQYDEVGARIDASGLQTLDLTGTTSRYLVRRVAPVDVEALADDFARREQAGKGLGVLSPRDTVRAAIGGAHLLVDYSRPAMRGRTVFGGLLAPFGQVWRTGADAATQLVTDRDVQIGGTLVPAGTYSIFSVPTATGWLLVLNRQHGQWGTEYHPERDLARIPLRIRSLSRQVERFTIALTPAGTAAGTLRLAWANREGSVAVRVR